MTEDRFIRKYSEVWERYEKILYPPGKTAKNQWGNLEYLNEVTSLYHMVSTHLSYATTHYPMSQVCEYLNRLVSSGHVMIYTPQPIGASSLLRFYKAILPRTIVNNLKYILIATGIFAMASLYSWFITLYDLSSITLFLPQEFVESLSSNEMGNIDWNHPIMSSTIMINNIKVALNSFAWGITLGLGTIYVLVINGFLLGSLSAYVTLEGSPLIYWSLILPHGVIELMAIFISGGAGLMIGMSILKPGIYSRKDAIIMAGREGLKLMGIVIPLLVFAAIIEGFFTPSSVSPVLKILFGVTTGIIALLYFFYPVLNLKKNC